jgi:hypothetical protein
LNRQKPIARVRTAWWPGGRCSEAPSAGRAGPVSEPLHQLVDHRDRAARRVQRGVEGAGRADRVEVERSAAGAADRLDRLDVLGRVHGLDERAVGGGRLARLEAGPVGLLQGPQDRGDARRLLGVGAGVVAQRRRVMEGHGARHAVSTVPAPCPPTPHASTSSSSARARPGCTPR